MIKVFIADDHYVVRRGLRQILSDEDDICITAEASNSAEVLQRTAQADWDVLILDIAMSGENGLDALIELKNKMPGSKILILSMHKESELVERAFRNGADGYLNKDSTPDELVKAIRTIHKGKSYVGSTIELETASAYESNVPDFPHKHLSEREFQVFCLLASGNSLKDIAENLSISSKTVSTYRSRILDKFHAKSNIDLVLYAIKHNLVPFL